MTASKRKKPLLKDYDGLDAAKAIAVIDGEMQDLRKVTARETPAGNAGLEISLHLRELQRIRTIFTDQQMAESMSAANLNDAAAIAAISHEEHAAQCDHEMALALQGGRNRATRTNINRPAATTNSTEIDATVLSKLAARHVSVSAGEALLPSTGQDTDSQSQRANRDCVICLDSKPWFELLSVPCQHDYCTDCLRSLFRDSYTDETLFPPKCCQQVIPINGADITLYLPKDLREPYETRRIETTTTNRTYCIACSKFILPSNITNHTAKCTACQTSTCAKCKKAAHTGDCVADENDRLALELAERQGWRACFQCRRTIELSHGCYHMRCLCGAEFCYRCGRRWKTCRCPQWAERRLYARANVISNRGRAGPADAREVREVADRLRTDHECNHEYWRRISGEHQCEECHDTLPLFIFECSQCHLHACRRCRRNRTLV